MSEDFAERPASPVCVRSRLAATAPPLFSQNSCLDQRPESGPPMRALSITLALRRVPHGLAKEYLIRPSSSPSLFLHSTTPLLHLIFSHLFPSSLSLTYNAQVRCPLRPRLERPRPGPGTRQPRHRRELRHWFVLKRTELSYSTVLTRFGAFQSRRRVSAPCRNRPSRATLLHPLLRRPTTRDSRRLSPTLG